MVTSIEDGTTPYDRLFILSLLFIPCLFINPNFVSDTYWLVNSGRYVIAHGIPHIEPFTLHQGLHFVMQQWLSATLFGIIYEALGSPFIFVLIAMMKGLIIYSVYCLCMRISERNFLLSFTIAFAVSIPIGFFIAPRPQVFSLFLFTMELNLLEAWIERNLPSGVPSYTPANIPGHVKAYRSSFKADALLWWLPILSVLLINLHAAMWPFFFILLVPYAIDGFRFNLLGVKGQGYRLSPLIIAAIISFAAGWINPYGFESMSYLYHSYGHPTISSLIVEMRSPDFKSFVGIMYVIIYLVPILVYARHTGEPRLRHSLLMIGTGYMGLASARSLSLFLVCGIPFLARPLKSFQMLKAPDAKPRLPWLRFLLLAAILSMIGSYFFFSVKNSEQRAESSLPMKAVDYIIKHLDKDGIRLFNTLNIGGYAEFRGLHPFIDTRAEAFIKSNNQKEDIIDDYFNAAFGKMHYRKLIDKYKLTHFLVEKTDLLYAYLPEDPDFELLLTDGDFKLFAHKTVFYRD